MAICSIQYWSLEKSVRIFKECNKIINFQAFKRITLQNVTNVQRFKRNERYMIKINKKECTMNEQANLQVIRSSRADVFLSTLYRFC